MTLASAVVHLHVGAGAAWALVSLAIAARQRAGRLLFALQMLAALATLLAGIALWALFHGGSMGPAEHLLVLGTFCAFVALGVQLGSAGPAVRGVRLAGGTLVLAWAGVGFLVLAAGAMLGSRFP